MKFFQNSLFFLIIIFQVAPLLAQSGKKYDSVVISFSNPALGFEATLEGTLQLPGKSGPFPLVIFIHGSGQTTRLEYSNLFDDFLSRDIAVFSYDKRGVGNSTGKYFGVGPKNSPMLIPLLASDASEAINSLKLRPEIDKSKIILMGASQAGWIIPVVANMNRTSGYVVLTGPTVSVGEEIYFSSLAENHKHSQQIAEQKLSTFSGINGFDPIFYLSNSQIKSLWLFGGKDISVPTKRSIELLDSLTLTGNKSFTIKMYPTAGHGLIDNESGKPEKFIPVMVEWIRRQIPE